MQYIPKKSNFDYLNNEDILIISDKLYDKLRTLLNSDKFINLSFNNFY